MSNFAESLDIPPTSIYNALNRGLANTRTELTDKIYRKLNIDWGTAKLDNDFRGLRLKSHESDFTDVSLYGSIAAGIPIEMVESETLHPVPTAIHRRYPEAFLLKVEGDLSYIAPSKISKDIMITATDERVIELVGTVVWFQPAEELEYGVVGRGKD